MNRVRIRTTAAAIALSCLSLAAFAGQPCGVYVAPIGDDMNGGLLPGEPLRTINAAIDLAESEGLSCVFVQAGDYAEVVHLAAGVTVDGGYDTSWVRGDRLSPQHQVRIIGQFDKPLNRFVAVVANGLADVATVSNLIVNGSPAGGMTAQGDGMSSYAAWVNNSVLVRFVDVTVNTGAGADAADGAPGVGVGGGPAPQGAGGSPGENVGACDDSTRPGGGGGGISGGVMSTRGGMGGRGGRADSNCNFPFDFSAAPGDPGMPAASGPGAGGNSGGTCNNGGPGSPG